MRNLIFIGRLNSVTILLSPGVVSFVGDGSVDGDQMIGDGKVQLTLNLLLCNSVLSLHVAINAVHVGDLFLRPYEVYRSPELLDHQWVGLAATNWRRSDHAVSRYRRLH